MKLAIWAMGSVFIFSTIVVWVMTHPNRDRAADMSSELAKLHEQNDDLSSQNKRLTRDVEALRNDPRIIARKAREVGPYVGPNEYVVQFKPADTKKPVEVLIRAETDHVSVAGKKLNDEQLKTALATQASEIEGARFVLEHHKEVEQARIDSLRSVVNEFNNSQITNENEERTN